MPSVVTLFTFRETTGSFSITFFFSVCARRRGRVVAVVSLSILQDVSIHHRLPPPFSTIVTHYSIDEWLIFAIETINQSGDY